MAKASPEQTRRRRRGPELEAALLEAAWDELVEAGFAPLTMESVAARAHTGIAVLYRRWPNKDELVLAAIRHYGEGRPVETPDTGSLRGDLLALLTSMSKARATFSGLLADTGLTPAQVRDKILGTRPPRRDLVIFRRAHERGELDLDRVPPTVLTMPFDLVRHDMLINLKPLKPARIKAIVDDLFLPLVGGRG
jgi:AcrR family transcriptional regulator